MTDFGAQVRAAIQQVRTSTPRECSLGCVPPTHSMWCEERFGARVDARLAVCVEAAIEAAGTAQRRSLAFLLDPTAMDDSHIVSFEAAGLAAFLAAAAQKERL